MSERSKKSLHRSISVSVAGRFLAWMNDRVTERAVLSVTRQFRRWSNDSRLCHPWNALVGLEHVEVGARFHANTGLFLGAYGPANGQAQIVIGDDVLINYDCQISATNQITIGNEVLIGSRVLITDHSHGDFSTDDLKLPPLKRPLRSKGPVVIGNNVWIGSGVSILPGVTLGESCVVGANSVVTKSFSARSLIAGNPARLVRSLGPT